MCSASSNCSRIDAVKATANQLKLQKLQQAAVKNPDGFQSKAVKSGLAELDASIQTGDAQKAELALANARNAIQRLDAAPASGSRLQPAQDRPSFRQFVAYA